MPLFHEILRVRKPLFPEVETTLRELQELAEDGAVYVISRSRDPGVNWRTQFTKILRRAGLEAWPKLFHQMRISRQTELAAVHPLHVVCEWMGNNRLIVQEHDLRSTDADFRRAVASVTLKPTDSTDANSDAACFGNGAQETAPDTEDDEKTREFAAVCEDSRDERWSLLDSNQ